MNTVLSFTSDNIQPKLIYLKMKINFIAIFIICLIWSFACINFVINVNLLAGLVISIISIPLNVLFFHSNWKRYQKQKKINLVASISVLEDKIRIDYFNEEEIFKQ